MELGQRIRAARLEAGLSQRQLCGDKITRNMLSQIENGSAKPSMETLRYLATGLGKSISFFLEDDAVNSANQQRMAHARKAYGRQDYEAALAALEAFQEPDESFSQERALLQFLSLLALAEKAAAEGRMPYVLRLLEKASALEGIYIDAPLRSRAAILAAKAGAETTLPNADELLLLRAGRALAEKNAGLAAALLDSVEQRQQDWYLLRGQAYMLCREYAAAKAVLEQARTEKAWPLLEQCCKDMGDFKGAYEYACKRRDN